MPIATKKQLREEISALRNIGRQMANVCFNLSQGSSPTDLGKLVSGANLNIMNQLRIQWDAIPRSEKRPL